jgi:hypothetical protein
MVTGTDVGRDGAASNVNQTCHGTHQRVTVPTRGMPLAMAAASRRAYRTGSPFRAGSVRFP